METTGNILSRRPPRGVAPKPLRLLVAEDNDDDALLLIRLLREHGYAPDFVRVASRAACCRAMDDHVFDLIIADYSMPQFTALDVIAMMREREIDAPLIVVSGTIGESVAVETMRAGAADYIMKGNLSRLIPAIERELDEAARRAAHRDVERRHHLLNTAIEQAAEAVVITDTKGIIEYANPAFVNVSGYTPEEVVGQYIGIFKSGAHDSAFYKDLWHVLLSGRPWRGRFKNRRKNGSFYEEEAVISPVRDASGAVVNYVAVKRDVTRERELEQQLNQSQKFKAIGQFAHKVVHDFTNVLMMITGHAELARQQLPPTSPAQEHFDGITKAANKITAFVAQLMAFVHPSPPKTTTMSLARLVDGVDEIIRQVAEPAVQLTIDIRDKDARVKVDPSQIEQVIVHTVANAVEAMPSGGKLTIAVSSTRIPGEDAPPVEVAPGPAGAPHQHYAMLVIADTGCGMTKEMLSHAFDPFFTTKKHRENAGLGLSVVYRIIDQHHGRITVQSQPGEGSTFTFFLPLADAPRTPA